MSTNTSIHPRLQRQREAIGAIFKLDDPSELTAALEDIQTLLDRCGYHLRFLRHEQALKRKRPSRRSQSPGAAVRRGRPPGSANWAARQLGLGLATIWSEYSLRKPTRRFDGYGDAREHGPYREFVALVRDVLPLPLRKTRKDHVPEVDHLVRISIEEFKAARSSADESRRRGLIEERRWLGNNASTTPP